MSGRGGAAPGADADIEPDAGADTDDVLERAHEARLLQAGQMLAGIVHEIRNPLAVIQGYAQLLLDRCRDGEDREDLDLLLTETHRLGAMIEDMLAFLRRGPDASERVDLNRVVQAAVHLTTHAMRQARVSVVASLPEAAVLVRGQHGAYVQVLMNLLHNARESLQQADRADAGISLSVRPGGPGHTEVLVCNNGPPIPREHVDNIFEAFFTTKGEGDGTGLGLTLCRDILERFGGTITLDDLDTSTGVRFRLELPSA